MILANNNPFYNNKCSFVVRGSLESAGCLLWRPCTVFCQSRWQEKKSRIQTRWFCSRHNHNPLSARLAKHLDKVLHKHKPTQSTSTFSLSKKGSESQHSKAKEASSGISSLLWYQFILSQPCMTGWVLWIAMTVIFVHSASQVCSMWASVQISMCVCVCVGTPAICLQPKPLRSCMI